MRNLLNGESLTDDQRQSAIQHLVDEEGMEETEAATALE
jgi:hypothetical protein